MEIRFLLFVGVRRRRTTKSTTLFPMFSSLLLVVAYIGMRKIYCRLRRSKTTTHSMTVVIPEEPATTSTLPKLLTKFEIATGAVLTSQFGLVCDYLTHRSIKGIRYASADGVYMNGVVISDNKYLIQTGDLPAIMLMKLTKRRFLNVFIYDVNHYNVQPLARLVYPEWADLVLLNFSVLSKLQHAPPPTSLDDDMILQKDILKTQRRSVMYLEVSIAFHLIEKVSHVTEYKQGARLAIKERILTPTQYGKEGLFAYSPDYFKNVICTGGLCSGCSDRR
ncbi:TPA: hypothetical protein N0F65_005913 [Lagenidium giganteum]|uniref:Uncharacterized protein n=1 Tax=Lagenidium giganteum TaxID=4803 RepID=A0AAV2Z997_9STRA|nr:TPA: hypothetical protein N0F65_005913 [Lagenidium giganteum]